MKQRDALILHETLYVGQRPVGHVNGVCGRTLRSGRRSGRGKRALKIGLGLVLMALLFAVFYYVYREIRTSSFFQLTRIEVAGNRIVPEEEICSRSGLLEQKGTCLFDVDLREVVKRVKEDVRIRDVRVSRKMPNRIRISVKERTPVGWVGLDRLYGVDREGILMPPLDPSVMLDLPILTGLEDMKSFEVGDSLIARCPRLKQAIVFLDSLQQVDPGFLDMISEIRVDRSNEMVLCLMDSGTRVRISERGLRSALIRLRSVLDRLTMEGRLAHSIDLRFKGQAVVRF